jgi:hypothetical protein
MSFASTISRIKGALLSKKSSAYFGIMMIGLGPIFRILDAVLLKYFAKTHQLTEVPPTILIVSPPRSGSTITYQVLGRLIPCVYYTNLHAILPKYASTSLLKNDAFGKVKGFNNYYGYSAGWNDVNEGNDVVSSFFDRAKDKAEIRRRFLEFCSDLGASNERPLIFKNVRNYFQIDKLIEAVPEIIILRVKRNIEQIIQSEVKGYKELKSFHPIPLELEGQEFTLKPTVFATKQIVSLERRLDEQSVYLKDQLNFQNWIETNYESFCEDPKRLCEILLNKLNSKLELRDLSFQLKASFTKKVSDSEVKEIQDELKSLNYERA